MGRDLPQRDFTDEDRERFRARLRASLGLLDGLLTSPGFGAGEPTLGAELEMFTIAPPPWARISGRAARHARTTL